MCKQQGHKFCAELGADSALWSKHAPLPKPGWIDDAFLVLSQALKLILDDKAIEAKFLLKNSRDLEMRPHFENPHNQYQSESKHS
jgi:hypothetical protein